jgi:hypothetical protein
LRESSPTVRTLSIEPNVLGTTSSTSRRTAVMSYSSGTLNRDSAGALGAGAPTSGGSVLVEGASREQERRAGSSTTTNRVVANDGTGTTD